MGTCHLLLQELNHVMLWLLPFNTPWKEFWVENRKRKRWQVLFSWAAKSLQMVTADMKLKDTCSLEEKP